ncbi:MAG: adenylate/guanylate cyclase domain-containing protein [Betaproteobacteria bacterium]|nr:adenylate/guanylate cyclase domain-containing protein [Betaproteobacteria bacterium]
MLTRGNRTFICSVAFLDVVEYSRLPVAEQIKLKEQLNALLGEALRDVAANDRVILDTGDGAAISFVGDPEDALFVSMALRDSMTAPRSGSPMPLRLRIGINLGPVKLVRDLNGQPNIIGDGINVAQRVMGFALPNQILVSRSYYEVVSCLSEAYARLFRYEGSRTDKHVREHEVYAVGDSTGEIRRMQEAAHATTTGLLSGSGITRTVIGSLTQSARQVTENLRTRPRLGTALAVVAILVTAVALRGLRDRPGEPIQARAPAATATTAPAAVRPAVTPPQEKVIPTPAPPPRRAVEPKRAAEPKPAAPAGEPGFITFAITPWGEIYVDGKKQGVSPPLQEVQVSPGPHQVEVRNTTFTPYAQSVEVKPGERFRIRHRFR